MWVTIKKYAELMSISERHIHNLIKVGRLEVIDLSLEPEKRHCWRIKYDA